MLKVMFLVLLLCVVNNMALAQNTPCSGKKVGITLHG